MQIIDGLVQNCNNSMANALELLVSSTKPLSPGLPKGSTSQSEMT